jgi:heme/copper-type cytochrome/quinol oxidase subunit 1
MSLSPSSTGNLIFGLLISGISSCLTSLNFWTTILNLRSYYLTLKTMPLFLCPLRFHWNLLLCEVAIYHISLCLGTPNVDTSYRPSFGLSLLL